MDDFDIQALPETLGSLSVDDKNLCLNETDHTLELAPTSLVVHNIEEHPVVDVLFILDDKCKSATGSPGVVDRNISDNVDSRNSGFSFLRQDIYPMSFEEIKVNSALDNKGEHSASSLFLFLFEKFTKINEFLKYYDPFPNFLILPGVEARRALGRVATPPPVNIARPTSGNAFYNPFQSFAAANSNTPRAANNNFRYPTNPSYMPYATGTREHKYSCLSPNTNFV